MVKGKRVLERAIITYGENKQHDIVIEESLELLKEVCKWKRGANNREAIIEETADLLIMLEQLKMMHRITEQELEKVMKYKIDRLEKRLNNK